MVHHVARAFAPGNGAPIDEDPTGITANDAAKEKRLNPTDVPMNCRYLEIDAAMTEDREAALGLCLTTCRIDAPHLKSAEA